MTDSTTTECPTVPLAGGRRIPILGFGTWQLPGDQAYQPTRDALEIGYRHLDTATAYQNQPEVGRALRDSGVPREQVFITTKLPPDNAGKEQETLEASLRELGTDYLDLWLIHWPPNKQAAPETWQELVKAKESGKARSIGVSNYSTAQIDELIAATGVTPEVDQIRWSPKIYDAARAAELAARGVALEGYSPIRASDLDDPALVEIAGAHGKTVAQVILRWHVDHGYIAIPKSAHRERIAENYDVLDFALSAAEVARLDALGGHDA